MATIKKPAKKTAAKKPAAKKPAAKKPAAKAAVKKPAAKKTVAKAAVKKPAAKKPAAKAAAVKKPAAKATGNAAKAASKKPAVKASTKVAAVKKAAVKPAAKAATKVATVKKPAQAAVSNLKFMNLFEAFSQGKLPLAQGYIVSSFFNATNAYSIYEIVSYAGVKEIFPSGEGLQFISGGKKLHVLVEPDTYHNKPIEPVSRPEGEKIPKRFNELELFVTKNQSRIYIAKEPEEITGSFTVLKPQSFNFAVVFYQLPDMFETLSAFFEESLNRQRKVPQSDARKVAQVVTGILKKTMGFEGQYQ